MRAVVENLRGVAPSDRELEAIFLRGEGNPFLTCELAAAEGEKVPASVRDGLLARTHELDELGLGPRGLAAVIGARIPHGVLAVAARESDGVAGAAADVDAANKLSEGRGLDETRQASRQLRTAGGRADGYSLRHTLTREAVLNGLLPGDRRRLDAAVAPALAEQPGSNTDVGAATQVARHTCAQSA